MNPPQTNLLVVVVSLESYALESELHKQAGSQVAENQNF